MGRLPIMRSRSTSCRLSSKFPALKRDIQKNFGFTPKFEAGEGIPGRKRRRGKHVQGHGEACSDRHSRCGRDDDDLLHHRRLTDRMGTGSRAVRQPSIHNPLFLLGLIAGRRHHLLVHGSVDAGGQHGAYRAVEFIKANIKLEGTTRASVADSKKVVEICTQYAQKGMFNIFLTVFFATLGFAFVDAYFFIGYLISIALFGLFQAIFMANAGGAWDNAKKIVETELKAKGTDLHAATVVGDTVGDPFKDTSLGCAESHHQVHDPVRVAGCRTRRFAHCAARRWIDHGSGSVIPDWIDVLRYRSFYNMRIEGAEAKRELSKVH